MKYETIEACFTEMEKREPERFQVTTQRFFRIRDKFGGGYFGIKDLTIDAMYAILNEIGYTMYPQRRHPLNEWYGEYYDIAVRKRCSVHVDNFATVFFTPEQCFPPAFLAALNHYLE